MKRKSLAELRRWADSGTKPMLLLGPRQVGKTWLMQELGRTAFDNALYINFEADEKLLTAFEPDLNPHQIVSRLSAYTLSKITPDTLLIFDEIQAGGRALTALKYFRENAPEYRVIAAGSLLGVSLSPDISFPVGQVDMQDIYPMTFTEYLWATGREIWAETLEQWDPTDSQAFIPHDQILDVFREYMFVGGMPAAVTAWIESADPQFTRREQAAVLAAYQKDIGRHAPREDAGKIWQIWDSVPRQLARESSQHFRWNDIASGARSSRYSSALSWLLQTGIIHRVPLSEHPAVPLLQTSSVSKFKIFLADVGLSGAATHSPADAQASTYSPNYRGSAAETYVLQSLIAQGKRDVHYWGSGNKAEVDFLSVLSSHVVPVEVKSGDNVRARSLAEFRKKYNPELAVRLSTRPPGYVDGLLSLPIYMADHLVRVDRLLTERA